MLATTTSVTASVERFKRFTNEKTRFGRPKRVLFERCSSDATGMKPDRGHTIGITYRLATEISAGIVIDLQEIINRVIFCLQFTQRCTECVP